MDLVVISHKLCWRDASAPSGYVTDGGFPFHMASIARLFDSTRVLVPVSPASSPPGTGPLHGHQLSIEPLNVPFGSGNRRKLGFLWVLPENLVSIWQAVHAADAVHVPVPGDLGMLGIIVALVQRKPLFVRHCGNWLSQRSVMEHILKALMERFAGGKNVMFATGGGQTPPSGRNLAIRWIFSSGLTTAQLAAYARPDRQRPTTAPRLLIACRQEWDKGTDILLDSLSQILAVHPGARLDVVGDGSALPAFKDQAAKLGLSEHVTFHGKVKHGEVMDLMREADLFCYPTTASEGFPKVVLEALASGLPVVTTPVSVLPHLIGKGGGVIVEATPDAIAQAALSCLADDARYQQMAAKGVQTARQYSRERWEATIESTLVDAWGPLRADG